MKFYFFQVLFILLFFNACSNNKKDKGNNKLVRITEHNGEIKVGYIINRDSLFDGKVKYYTAKDIYYGYTNFEKGIANGPSVKYHNNGRISDSTTLKNGYINGMAFKFDTTGSLIYKCNYFQDRVLGHNYEYDSIGNISSYYFLDFEGNLLFDQKISVDNKGNKDTLQFGNLLYSRINRYQKNDSIKNKLFLYLMDPPFFKVRYEIAIVSEVGKIFSSKRIESDQCFYEIDLTENLENGKNEAIVYYVFNPGKQKEDLFISLIK